MHEISLTHQIAMGHRIVGHEGGRGKCARLHGHTYRFQVDITSPSLLPIGFVCDFGEIKRALDEWDHHLLLWENDPIFLVNNEELDEEYGIIRVSFNPTAERIAQYWAGRLLVGMQIQYAPEGESLSHDSHLSVLVRVWESDKSSAKYRMSAA